MATLLSRTPLGADPAGRGRRCEKPDTRGGGGRIAYGFGMAATLAAAGLLAATE
ncbi:MAG: hypothetical protein JF587_03040 [Catenulisporales bacterium]|nr:hypothetical protein [Catenulisporales bacterium]